MPQTLWFKRKKYGWGWTPANAKGWLAILVYVMAVSIYPLLGKFGLVPFSLVVFYVLTAGFTAGLFCLCYSKGEKPEWRWGNPK